MLHQTRFLVIIKRKKVGAEGPLKPNYGPFLIVCHERCCILMAETKTVYGHDTFLLRIHLQSYMKYRGTTALNCFSLNVTFLLINFIQARQYKSNICLSVLSPSSPPLCNSLATCRKEIGAKPKYSL